jgi:predicted nucleic acid-binding protein
MTFLADRPPVVLDASVAIELVTDPTSELEAVLAGWVERAHPRLVPATFWAEAANGMLSRGRAEPSEVADRLAVIQGFGVEVADRRLAGVIDAVGLAHRHRLTVSDALYIQLALDVDGSLATLDRALARAARAENVPLEPLEPLELEAF